MKLNQNVKFKGGKEESSNLLSNPMTTRTKLVFLVRRVGCGSHTPCSTLRRFIKATVLHGDQTDDGAAAADDDSEKSRGWR